MLEHLDAGVDRGEICQQVDRLNSSLRENPRRVPRDWVYQAEERVSANPAEAFRFDPSGQAWLGDWQAGRFECVSLAGLRQRCRGGGGRLRLWILEGTTPVTDIGALQAHAPPGSLFQVASQFNCLESPGPYLVKVVNYFSDPTQGPRASVSAFPATLLRHYQAPGPDGGRFVQQPDGPQLNLLGAATPVSSGYLQAHDIRHPAELAAALRDRFEELQVGLHTDAQVVMGANWDGEVHGQPRIAQVFTSTLAAGGYGLVNFEDPDWASICCSLQRLAYLGTLLAAAATGQRRVVLTLIGGGVFGNPIPVIWDSIRWACQQVESYLAGDLSVIVNGRNLSHQLGLEVLRQASEEHGGGVLLCSAGGSRFL